MCNHKNTSHVIALLTGTTLGVLLGILLAPTQGKSLRCTLVYQTKRYTKKLCTLLAALLRRHRTAVVDQAKLAGQAVTQGVIKKANLLLADVNLLAEVLTKY